MRDARTGKKMKMNLAAILLSFAFAPYAMAADYSLQSGDWQFQEGFDVSHRTAGSSSKTFCVKPGETEANVDWFANLAKPNANCATKVVSHNSDQIRLEFSCPMKGATLKGPSTISINAQSITIDNDLALDLPYAPLPMGQKKTVRHVSNSCAGQ